MTSHGLDVRSRLLLSFLAAVAFTVLASAVAVNALYQLRSAMDTITTGHLPTIIAAFQLAQQSEATVANAPAMVSASVQGQRQTAYYRIRDQLSQIDEILIQLKSHDDAKPRPLDLVGRERSKLAATFETLNDMVEQRIASRRMGRDFLTGLVGLRRDLWSRLDALDPGVDPAVQRDLGRSLTLALDQLVAVSLTRNTIEVDAARRAFDKAMASSRSLMSRLPHSAVATMTKVVDHIATIGDEEEGLFTARKEELRAIEATDGLLSIYSHISSRLVFAVSELILHKQADIYRAANDSHALIELQTVFLFGLSGLCILGAIMVAIHIRHSIIARLFDLQRAMVAGAAGKTPAIDTTGTDEIARMAGALEVFIASRSRAEADLRDAKDAAEVANLAKTKFLAAASHDLRQPLQALGLFVTAMGGHDLPPEPLAIVDRMGVALEALRSLLDGLLDISKLEAGAVKPEVAVFPVGRLIARLQIEFEPLAAAKDLRLVVVRSSEAVISDPGLLDRMLRNLVANAIRYTDHGGVLIGCRRRGEVVRVEVWDTGRGIPEDQFEAIFREFHQLDNPGRDRSKGLGLGLAIVNRIGGLLGHRVGVTSTVGRGSRFAVELPRGILDQPGWDQETDRDRNRNRVTANEFHGKIVVVIDDEASIRDGMMLVLERWGCDVLAVATAEEAMEALTDADVRPDLIVADFRLAHHRTGDVAIARIRSMFPDDPPPAIIITGDTGPEQLGGIRLDGARLLHKPVKMDQLHDAVAAALGPSVSERGT